MLLMPLRSWARRIHAVGASVLLVCAVALAGPAMFRAERADALCAGSSYAYLYGQWANEFPNSGTCDSDNYYGGAIYDIVEDGSCVWIDYFDTSYAATQQYSCDAYGNGYGFWDTTSPGDSYAVIQVCRNQGCAYQNSATYGY